MACCAANGLELFLRVFTICQWCEKRGLKALCGIANPQQVSAVCGLLLCSSSRSVLFAPHGQILNGFRKRSAFHDWFVNGKVNKSVRRRRFEGLNLLSK
jgi:hypothetical protein